MTVVGIGEVPIVPDMKGFAAKVNAGATTGLSGLPGIATKVGKAVGLSLAAATVVGVGGLLKLGDMFDAEYDKIRVATGKTGKELDGLQGSFKKVLKDVPVDFGQAGDAVAGLNQRLGLTGKPLEEMAKRTAVLNKVVGGDLQTQIAGTTRVMGDWGVSVDKMPLHLDKLFRASQATGIPIEQLSEQLVKFGAPLRQLGFSFDESAALLGKFEKEGVNSNLVMGSMRIALGKMAKEGEPAQETFKRVTQQIKEAGSASEANKLALELFGAKAGPDMAAAIREGRFELGGLTDQIANGSDTILKAGEDTEDFAEKWARLRNRLAVALEPAAMKAFDILGQTMDWISTSVGPRLVEMFGRLRERLEPVGVWLRNAAEAAGFLFQNFREGTLTAEAFGEIMTLVFGESALGIMTRTGKIVGTLVDGFQSLAGAVRGILSAGLERLTDLWTGLVSALDANPELWAIIGAAILHFVIPALMAQLPIIAATTAGWLAQAAAVVVANAPLIAISLAIGAVVAGLLYAYNHFEAFRNVVDTVARVIRDVAMKAFEGLVMLWENYLLPGIQAVADFFVNVLWPAVQTAWDGILAVIRFAWEKVIQPIFNILKWYVEEVLVRAFMVWKFVVVDLVIPLIIAVIQEAWEILKGVFDVLAWVLDHTLGPAFQFLGWIAGIVWDGISAAVSGAWGKISPVFEAVRSFMADKLTPVWEGMRAAAAAAWDALPGIVNGALRLIGGIIGGFLSGVGGIADAIGLDHIAEVLKGGAATARSWGQGPVAPASANGISIQGGIRRNSGGGVPGPNVDADIVPAMLTPGEFVIRKASVQQFGPAFFEALNQGRMPGFRKGGLIPDPLDVIGGLADGVVDTVKAVGTKALETVWPKLGTDGDVFSAAGKGGAFVAGGANYLRESVLKLIRDEETKMGNLSGGGFTRQGGGGPAGQYTAGMLRAKAAIQSLFGITNVGGYAARNIAGTKSISQHALHRAWDFMVGTGNVSKGNQIANWLIAHAGEFGLKGLIWNNQKNFGAGWGPYKHPGGGNSPTLRHEDHVHAEFFRDGGLVHGASFDSGGILAPGWNKVRNDTGAPEHLVPAGRGALIEHAHFNDRESVDELFRRAEFELTRRNF